MPISESLRRSKLRRTQRRPISELETTVTNKLNDSSEKILNAKKTGRRSILELEPTVTIKENHFFLLSVKEAEREDYCGIVPGDHEASAKLAVGENTIKAKRIFTTLIIWMDMKSRDPGPSSSWSAAKPSRTDLEESCRSRGSPKLVDVYVAMSPPVSNRVREFIRTLFQIAENYWTHQFTFCDTAKFNFISNRRISLYYDQGAKRNEMTIANFPPPKDSLCVSTKRLDSRYFDDFFQRTDSVKLPAKGSCCGISSTQERFLGIRKLLLKLRNTLNLIWLLID
ncbi:unnamed protein product [Caenorhabditis nigoni]